MFWLLLGFAAVFSLLGCLLVLLVVVGSPGVKQQMDDMGLHDTQVAQGGFSPSRSDGSVSPRRDAWVARHVAED